VVAYVGDGALTMLIGEIATLVKYKLPVKLFVSKNNALGLIRWEQMMFLGHPEYGIKLQEIDFAAIARACGATGLRVDHPGELEAVVHQALATPGPVVVEGIVDPFEPVMPGHIMAGQAGHYAEALRSGQPNEKRIGLTLCRDMLEDGPDNFRLLNEAVSKQAPEAFPAVEAPDSGRGAEPRATLEAQREAAQERTSGQPVPAR